MITNCFQVLCSRDRSVTPRYQCMCPPCCLPVQVATALSAGLLHLRFCRSPKLLHVCILYPPTLLPPPREPPLSLVSDGEVVEHLWSGDKSVAKRAAAAAAAFGLDPQVRGCSTGLPRMLCCHLVCVWACCAGRALCYLPGRGDLHMTCMCLAFLGSGFQAGQRDLPILHNIGPTPGPVLSAVWARSLALPG